MTLKDVLLNRFKKEFSKSSYVNHYFPIYIVFNILIILCLSYSAFASFSYYKALLRDFPLFWCNSISFLITCLISALIYYFSGHVARTWFTYYKADIVIIFLSCFVGWNIYTDLLGVQSFSENTNQQKENIQTNNLDDNYKITIADFDRQIKENIRLNSLNSDWNKNNNPNWHKYNIFKKSSEEKERLEKEKSKFIAEYSTQRAKSIDLYSIQEHQRFDKIKRNSNSLKGIATVCMVVTMLCSFWCANYKKKSVTSCSTEHNSRSLQRSNDSEQTQNLGFQVAASKDILNQYPKVVEMLKNGYGINKTHKALNVPHNRVYEIYKILNNK